MLVPYARGLWVESWLGHVLFSSPVTDSWPCISRGPSSMLGLRAAKELSRQFCQGSEQICGQI